jgi:hypothetical protein
MIEHQQSWAAQEFSEVALGDKRLDARLVKLCDSFSDSPESPINQACADWKETKAAYRFFQNESVDVASIMAAHRHKTAGRAGERDVILALQDTSYFIYTSHSGTEGLGEISMKKGKNVPKIYSHGLMMHACLAVTTEGLPLGLLDQSIVARQLRPENQRRGVGGKRTQDVRPVEEKESYRWLEALAASTKAVAKTQVVTVCDREADFYDFFRLSNQLGAPVLVRASQDRTVNRKSRYAEKGVAKLWDHICQQPEAGSYQIDIPRRQKTKHCEARVARTATVAVKFGAFTMSPSRNHPKHRDGNLPDVEMHAVLVRELCPPEGEEPIEWMLLTNQPVTSFEDACEKIRWYGFRWRIEMYFKVLKSGFRVEACRLATGERLTRYLAVMSIVAWRIFMITLMARTDPNTPCTKFLAQQEWRILFLINKSSNNPPTMPPTIGEAVTWIAKLGGYLDRKGDGPPGTMTLWRGWKRLADLTAGWNLATQS